MRKLLHGSETGSLANSANPAMGGRDIRGELHGYVRGAREVVVWKLDGLDEYDIRRP